ncbi:MAG: PilZ domain-containing protein [Bosea sp. (in: a-proteobacteria)]|jgi:hypothetical protein
MDRFLTGSEADKRRAKRHQVRLAGRYLLADRTEWDCQTVDMSPVGLLLRGQARPYHGQIVVVYLAGLGRIEGTVVRLKSDEFALRIQATDRKREQLAAWLEGLANGESAPRRIDPAVLERAAEQAAERAWIQDQAQPEAPAPSQPTVHPAVGYRIYLDSL